jgi:hypothetical protein
LYFTGFFFSNSVFLSSVSSLGIFPYFCAHFLYISLYSFLRILPRYHWRNVLQRKLRILRSQAKLTPRKASLNLSDTQKICDRSAGRRIRKFLPQPSCY